MVSNLKRELRFVDPIDKHAQNKFQFDRYLVGVRMEIITLSHKFNWHEWANVFELWFANPLLKSPRFFFYPFGLIPLRLFEYVYACEIYYFFCSSHT